MLRKSCPEPKTLFHLDSRIRKSTAQIIDVITKQPVSFFSIPPYLHSQKCRSTNSRSSPPHSHGVNLGFWRKNVQHSNGRTKPWRNAVLLLQAIGSWQSKFCRSLCLPQTLCFLVYPIHASTHARASCREPCFCLPPSTELIGHHDIHQTPSLCVPRSSLTFSAILADPCGLHLASVALYRGIRYILIVAPEARPAVESHRRYLPVVSPLCTCLCARDLRSIKTLNQQGKRASARVPREGNTGRWVAGITMSME